MCFTTLWISGSSITWWVVGGRGRELRLPTSAGLRLDLDDLGGCQQRLLMAAVPWFGVGFALGASAGWPLLIRRIGRGGTIGIAGTLLHAGFKLGDPRLQRLDPGFQWLDGRVLLLDDLHQLQDHLAQDEGGLCPTGGIQWKPCW
jgi:hypothetical protein